MNVTQWKNSRWTYTRFNRFNSSALTSPLGIASNRSSPCHVCSPECRRNESILGWNSHLREFFGDVLAGVDSSRQSHTQGGPSTKIGPSVTTGPAMEDVRDPDTTSEGKCSCSAVQ